MPSVPPSAAPPRLLVLTSTWPRHPRDVVGRFVSELVEALPWSARVVCPADPAHGPPALPAVPVTTFAHRRVFYGAGAPAALASGRASPLAALGAVAAMARTALPLARTSDLLFSHWAVPGGLVGALCRRLTGRPHALLLHAGDVHWLEGHPAGPALARRIADGCDLLCGVSPAVVARFEALSGRRGLVLGCGVADPLAGATAPRGGPGAGCLARLVPGKGLRRLAGAWPAGAPPLRLAGDGPLADELATLARAGAPLVLDGPRLGDARRAWLRGLDVFAAPTTGTPWGQPEGRPMAVVEARRAGLPVVAFAGALPDDLVRHGVDGLLVPPDDWTAFAGAARRLLDDPARRRRLGDRARSDSRDDDLDLVAARWTALFGALLGRGPLAPVCYRAMRGATDAPPPGTTSP